MVEPRDLGPTRSRAKRGMVATAVAVAAISGAVAATPASAAAGPSTAAPGASGEYTAVLPHRVVDTRSQGGALQAGESRSVVVVGAGEVPTADVSSVVVNVTATAPTADTYLSVVSGDNDATPPGTSNLNVVAGQTASNLVTVPLGAAGDVNVFNLWGTVHVVVDVVGFYATADGPAGARFVPAPVPERILDSREGLGRPEGKLAGGATMTLDVTGASGAPANVTAVALNLTAVDTEADGFLTIWPNGPSKPTVSNLNYERGRTRAILVIVRVPANGKVDIYSLVPANVIADVVGWYTEERVGDRGRYVELPVAQRVIDTRAGGRLREMTSGDFESSFLGGSAAVLNVTAVDADGAGYVAAGPGMTNGRTSTLNFDSAAAVPNLAFTATGRGPDSPDSDPGIVVLQAGISDVHVVVDHVGFFV